MTQSKKIKKSQIHVSNILFSSFCSFSKFILCFRPPEQCQLMKTLCSELFLRCADSFHLVLMNLYLVIFLNHFYLLQTVVFIYLPSTIYANYCICHLLTVVECIHVKIMFLGFSLLYCGWGKIY